MDSDGYYETVRSGPYLNSWYKWGQFCWAPSFYLLEQRYERLVRTNYDERSGATYHLDKIDWSKDFDTDSTPDIELGVRYKDKLLVVRAKYRPVIIISSPISKFRNEDKRVTDECYLVAPVYSLGGDDEKTPYSPEFVDRLKAYAYPQFFYLPAGARLKEGFVRFDRIQVFRKDLLKQWPMLLKDGAGRILRDWLQVYQGAELEEVDNTLFMYRTEYMELLGLDP